MNGSIRSGCALSLLACLAAGCGGSDIAEPELAMVTGVVTIDGSPGANLMITFEPQVKDPQHMKTVGAGSTAETDGEGAYVLNYKGKPGAVVGKHIVRVAPIAGGGPAGGEAAVPIVAQIPPQYSSESNLIREVQKGDNTIDLALTSQ